MCVSLGWCVCRQTDRQTDGERQTWNLSSSKSMPLESFSSRSLYHASILCLHTGIEVKCQHHRPVFRANLGQDGKRRGIWVEGKMVEDKGKRVEVERCRQRVEKQRYL